MNEYEWLHGTALRVIVSVDMTVHDLYKSEDGSPKPHLLCLIFFQSKRNMWES